MNPIQYIRLFGIWLLVAVYSCMPLKPILPFASDFIAHTFNEFDHVATVHFENGKYHVHADVVNDSKSKSSQQEAPVNDLDLKTDVHFAPEINFSFLEHSTIIPETTKIALHTHAFVNGQSVSPNYPPPQVL